MADLEYGDCDCSLPCSCVVFEGKVYKGLESIIDDLITERSSLSAIAETTDGLEAERDDLLDYISVLEAQLKINEG